MVSTFYLDTSIVGGYFDAEFRAPTRLFWSDLIGGKCRGAISTLTLGELAPAPTNGRGLLEELPAACYDVTQLTPEIGALADEYIRAGIVGPAYRTDVVHGVAALIAEVKMIVS